MDNSSTLAIMRRQTANTLRQVERAQADAAALVQWYVALGGDAFANNITDAEYHRGGRNQGASQAGDGRSCAVSGAAGPGG